MNRIDRITAILIQLQSKRIVKAQEIADRFGISLRTVYRDIKTLDEAGIPIIGEAGVGYSIMEGYRLPPVMFTKEEATAFLTAEKLVEKFTDSSTQNSYKTAMYKVKAVLRLSDKDYLENIEQHIEVLDNHYLPKNRNDTTHLQSILKSISEKLVININYFANHNQQATNRDIEPVGIFYLGSYWHLIAFCRLRNDYRNFRIDRITSLTQTDLHFEKQHPSLKNYLSQVSQEKEMHTIVIRINKKIACYFGDQKFYNGFVSQKETGDTIEMTFLTESLHGFARWYMMFGEKADIISPDNLVVLVRKYVKELAKKIN